MFDAVRHSATCVNLLRDMSSAAKLRPSELRSAGAVIERMRAVNFTDDKIRVVIKALFCLDHMSRNEARRQLEMAFDVWDAGHRGYLTVDCVGEQSASETASRVEQRYVAGEMNALPALAATAVRRELKEAGGKGKVGMSHLRPRAPPSPRAPTHGRHKQCWQLFP